MDLKVLVKGTLSGDAFVMVNKKMAIRLGFSEAGLLGELIATHGMVDQGVNGSTFYKNGAEGEWFYLTQPSIEARLGIKRKEHDNGIKKLIKEGLIIKSQKGLPAKSYYRILWERIAEMLSEPLIPSGCTKGTSLDGRKEHPRVDEKAQLDVTKGTSIITNNNNKEIRTNNNNFVNKERPLTENDLLNITDSFYNEMANGRWSKDQWFKLTEKLVNEVINSEGYKDIENITGYLRGCLKRACYHYDYKHGLVEFTQPENSTVPFYNWLEESK
jgi:hypothetical protein